MLNNCHLITRDSHCFGKFYYYLCLVANEVSCYQSCILDCYDAITNSGLPLPWQNVMALIKKSSCNRLQNFMIWEVAILILMIRTMVFMLIFVF